MAGVTRVRPRSGQEIEEGALDLIKRFQKEVLETPSSFDVELFFDSELEDDTGIRPVFSELLPAKIGGVTDSLEMTCSVSKQLFEQRHRLTIERLLRSTIAHEIGHCYLHVPDAIANREMEQIFKGKASESFKRYQPEDLKLYENSEWQAWRFASALLMPEALFRRAVDANWSIRTIQNAFEVNPAFVRTRLKELKIPKSLKR